MTGLKFDTLYIFSNKFEFVPQGQIYYFDFVVFFVLKSIKVNYLCLKKY